MTSDAIEQRLSLFQKRLTSERSNSEDSLHHHFHLLRGRPGLTKVSASLFVPSCGNSCSAENAHATDIALDEQAHFGHCALHFDLTC